MKKVFCFLTVVFTIASAQAQLANTRWKSTLNINGMVNTIFDFRDNTVSLYTVVDSTVIETMKYNVNDSSMTVTKIDGQSDCDNDTPGKYRFKIQNDVMYLNLLQDGCDDRWTVIDSSRWTRYKDHPEVQVEEAILKQYPGVYQLEAGHPIIISYEGGKLYIEGPNNALPKLPLIAESNSRFFLKIAGVEMDFVKDANGKVTSLISHENKDQVLKKIK